jgi:hypothetical protein
MRQMPHGQWVPFEADEPHDCQRRPVDRATPSVKRSVPRPAEKPAEPFIPLYPKVPDSSTPGPNALRPQPTPRPISTPRLTPAPQDSGFPSHLGSTPTRRPISGLQPTPHGLSRLGTILAWIAGLLSSTIGLLFAAFGFLSLPLSVVATMHLTGWSWFGAIVCVLLFSCVPLVGQLGYLILAVMGAYYLWTANFDWQKAAYPLPQTFSVSNLSESELERFRTDVVRRSFEQACKSDAVKTIGFDGKLPARVASQCECFATNFVAKLTRNDLMDFEKSGRYSDELQQRLGTELRRACPS